MNRRSTPEADAQRAIVQALRFALPRDNSGSEDDQRVRMLRGVGQDAARLGQAVVDPVAGVGC